MMATLSELISRRISLQKKKPNKARLETLTAPIYPKSKKRFAQYEAEVFKFLLDEPNKEMLGIKKVMKFKALRVDGAVELIDGKLLAVEIKLRMNWLKACQAEWEFRRFLQKENARKLFPVVNGGIVFFEEFSGDWKKKAGGRPIENGWISWYSSHWDVEGRRLDLLRLCGGKLDPCPE